MTTLADLIAPFSATTFRADYYGKRPLHIARGGHPRPEILDWRRLNEALALTSYWNEDSLKLYFRNRPALKESYCDPPDSNNRKALANPDKVKAFLSLGASLVANHIHRVCGEVALVAEMLEGEFGARTFANVYCSFQGVQAFGTHFDLHDVFAFQAEGEKVWRVYEARADEPVNPVPPGDEAEQWLIQSRGKVLFEAHMKPGDVLYLPRGQYHDALTGAEASLHVTFGVLPATGLALFRLLERVAAGESPFRAYLPDARDERRLREHLQALARRIEAILVSPAFSADVLNHQRSQRNLSASYELPNRTQATWYSLGKKAQLVRRDEGHFLSFDKGEVAIDALQPTVAWMLQQRKFSREGIAAQQPGVSPAELSSLIDRLLDAGVLVDTEIQR